jgi:hypothetical protein
MLKVPTQPVIGETLTLFRWWRPDPSGSQPEWWDGEPLDGFLPRIEGLEAERRWMTWDTLSPPRITYSPIDDTPELWRVFVALPESEDAYLDFAKRYGLLTKGEILASFNISRQFGVPLCQWKLAHRTMRTVWRVYEAVQSRRTNELAKLIQIDERKAQARFVGQPVPGHSIRHGAYIAGKAIDVLKVWERHVLGVPNQSERLRRLAMTWVWRTVNLCMHGPQEGSPDSLAGGLVSVILDVNLHEDLKTAVVRFNPTDLLGAMWFQLAKTIEGNLKYRQCRNATCRGWFLLSPSGSGKRRHSQFCGDACRLKHWRRARRKHAKTRKG